MAREIRNISANLVAKNTNILIWSNFLIIALQHCITKTPNADIAKLKNGLKQLDTLSFSDAFEVSFAWTSTASSISIVSMIDIANGRYKMQSTILYKSNDYFLDRNIIQIFDLCLFWNFQQTVIIYISISNYLWIRVDLRKKFLYL